MCGIAGFIDFSKRSSGSILKSMADSLVHRGPDDSGYEFFDHHLAHIGLGFRRLSILDLSPAGHQPMHNTDNDAWIIFNGEIYNFREIRSELMKLGYSFISSSDTEVILKAYQEWGVKCIDHFIGMFAIALYDQAQQKVIFIRDRAGVKPFYYYHESGLFLFSSELKAFHRHPSFQKAIDPDALGLFFQYGYIPAPYAIFKGTFKLMPGYWMELDLRSEKLSQHKYWDIIDHYNLERLNISYEDALLETEKLLSSAFEYRMISDVPLGVFLSGGYDSSCVTALLQKGRSNRIKTFTIAFEDDKYNEAHHARKVAEHLGTDHEEYLCTYHEAMDLVPKLPEICDEPFGDPSIIPTTLVSKVARKHVTVALSADAADELFAGYPRHRKSLTYLQKFAALPSAIASVSSKIIPSHSGSVVSGSDRRSKLKMVLETSDPVKRFEAINQQFTAGEIRKILQERPGRLNTVFDEGDKLGEVNDLLGRILATEYKTYLVDDILHKVDRASMSVSLEAREPFLDHRIAELLARLPSSFKMSNDRQKILLKDIVHKYIPEPVMNRPKMGFGIPLEKWMRSDLKELFMNTLEPALTGQSGILKSEPVQHMTATFLQGKLRDFQRMWLVFVFQQWYQYWMKP